MLPRNTSRGKYSSRVACLVYLACLRSHVLRVYCNFESKQAISISLFSLGDAQITSRATAFFTGLWRRKHILALCAQEENFELDLRACLELTGNYL